jgi:hypothetical protein
MCFTQNNYFQKGLYFYSCWNQSNDVNAVFKLYNIGLKPIFIKRCFLYYNTIVNWICFFSILIYLGYFTVTCWCNFTTVYRWQSLL